MPVRSRRDFALSRVIRGRALSIDVTMLLDKQRYNDSYEQSKSLCTMELRSWIAD
jgi:hypothetical protein